MLSAFVNNPVLMHN